MQASLPDLSREWAIAPPVYYCYIPRALMGLLSVMHSNPKRPQIKDMRALQQDMTHLKCAGIGPVHADMRPIDSLMPVVIHTGARAD